MGKGSGGGNRGSSKGQVHDVFVKRLRELQADAENHCQALQGQAQRKWDVPDEFTGDLLDPEGLHQPAFDREPINTNYLECMKDPKSPGTGGDVISLKQQMDYNAAEEAAFRFRHASVCRCLVHAAARRYGLAKGRTYPAIEEQASKIIQCGAV